MGHFVSYNPNNFADLNSVKTTLLETDATLNPHDLIVNGLSVTNKTTSIIRFSLQEIIDEFPTSTTILRLNQEEIPPRGTIDFIETKGLSIVLKYLLAPTLKTSLVGFTNDVQQLYDCAVTYTSLNDT